MKLLLYHNIIHPYKVLFFRGIARNIKGTVTLFTTSKKRSVRHELGDIFIDEPNLKIRKFPCINKWFLGSWFNIGLFRAVLNQDFDILMTGDYKFFSTIKTFFAAKLKGKPVVLYTYRNTQVSLPERFHYAGNYFAELIYSTIRLLPIVYWTLPRYDLIITPTLQALQHMIDCGVNPKKIKIIPDSVDLNSFSPREKDYDLIKFFNIDSDDIVIGFVGRLVEGKGITFLIEAIRILVKEKRRKIHLILIGDGPDKKKLEEQVRVSNIAEKVTFVGTIAYEQVPRYHSLMDIFVLPSIPQKHNIEQLCNALMEALSSGLGIVVFDINAGFKTYLKDKYNCLMAKEISGNYLAKTIDQYLTNPELLKNMQIQARTTAVNNFSFDSVGKKYVEAFESILKDKIN